MKNEAKQLSNSFSTGGGGVIFETRVQAAFVALMLSGGVCPCLPYPWPIAKVALQARHLDYETDDAVAFARNDDTGEECRLLFQIKHSISFTKRDPQMPDVMGAAWRDFNRSTHFDPQKDSIALVTGPISKTDQNSVCRLLEIARASSDESDFFAKKDQSKIVSKTQREKYEAIHHHISNADKKGTLDKKSIWQFLKSFYLISFDMDLETGVGTSLIQSLIRANSPDSPQAVWNMIVQEVQQKNSASGIIAPNSVNRQLQDCFNRTERKPIITIAPKPVKETVALNLIGGWDEKSTGDQSIIEDFSGMAFADWQVKIREVWKEQS